MSAKPCPEPPWYDEEGCVDGRLKHECKYAETDTHQSLRRDGTRRVHECICGARVVEDA